MAKKRPTNRAGSNGAAAAPRTSAAPTTAAPTTDAPKKPVRDIDIRISEMQQQLKRLEGQKFRAKLKDIVKANPECKALARDLEAVRKSRIVFADWGGEDLLERLDEIFVQIEESLMEKVADVTGAARADTPDSDSDGDDLPDVPPLDAAPDDADDLLAG